MFQFIIYLFKNLKSVWDSHKNHVLFSKKYFALEVFKNILHDVIIKVSRCPVVPRWSKSGGPLFELLPAWFYFWSAAIRYLNGPAQSVVFCTFTSSGLPTTVHTKVSTTCEITILPFIRFRRGVVPMLLLYMCCCEFLSCKTMGASSSHSYHV